MADTLRTGTFPRQMLSYASKTKKWAKSVADWAEARTYYNDTSVSASVREMRINYDLLNGKLHVDDMRDMINPYDQDSSLFPKEIRHFPIMNSKINVLIGEESKRVFDYSVNLTNPSAITTADDAKRQAVLQALTQLMQQGVQDENEFNQKLDKISDWFRYTYRDMKEVTANELLKYLVAEQNIPAIFNNGFKDVCATGCEVYQCVIVGGEPKIYKIDPMTVRVYRSGYSNRIEDADAVIIEEYWSPGRIYDTFYDVLTKKDCDYIESINERSWSDVNEMGYRDERKGFIDKHMVSEEFVRGDEVFAKPGNGLFLHEDSNLLPYDTDGNIRVIRVYWKSRRRLNRIKSYDPQTGEEIYELYPENVHANKELGEEEKALWVNEAWEATKIGEEVYVNMRPCPVQYATSSNPSRCHFGIIGSYYNLNGDRPFSLVSMMKPYNYEYDIIHDHLRRTLARDMGKVIPLDLAKMPGDREKWPIEKILYFAKVNGILIQDSFNEGNIGAATGKLAGALNNNTGVFDAAAGQYIQQYIQLMEWLKGEMGDVIGVNRQREGQVYNRETVGGIERANLQSSHITEYLYVTHDDVKKRVYEALLETARIAYKGNSKKFYSVLSDGARTLIELDGDDFAMGEYGLVVDNSDWSNEFRQRLDSLAQAALQNSLLNFSTVCKLFGNTSMMEKQRLIEDAEEKMQQRQEQAQQQQQEALQQAQQQQAESEMLKMNMQDSMNERDNETRVLVAQIQSEGRIEAERAYGEALNENDGVQEPMSQEARAKLDEQIREYDQAMRLENQKLENQKRFKTRELDIKERSLGLKR